MRPTAAKRAYWAYCPAWWACSRPPKRSSCCWTSARRCPAVCCISTRWRCASAKPGSPRIRPARCARRVGPSPDTSTTSNSVRVDWPFRRAGSRRFVLALGPALGAWVQLHAEHRVTVDAVDGEDSRLAVAIHDADDFLDVDVQHAMAALAALTLDRHAFAP